MQTARLYSLLPAGTII
jgi:hypothetical protein